MSVPGDSLNVGQFNKAMADRTQGLQDKINQLTNADREGEMSMSEMMELQRMSNQLTQSAELSNQVNQMFHSAYMSFIRQVGKSQ